MSKFININPNDRACKYVNAQHVNSIGARRVPYTRNKYEIQVFMNNSIEWCCGVFGGCSPMHEINSDYNFNTIKQANEHLKQQLDPSGVIGQPDSVSPQGFGEIGPTGLTDPSGFFGEIGTTEATEATEATGPSFFGETGATGPIGPSAINITR